MSKNESRRDRRKQERKEEPKRSEQTTSSGISKVYYWIIGALFLVLILIIVFIFNRSGDNVNVGEEGDESSLVQQADPNEESETDPTDPMNETEENQEDTEEPANEENADETEETEEITEDAEEEEPAEEESTTVNEDAPLDTNYATDFGNGSADRVAIKNQIMQATGLSDNLIEWWVGNNGPGRVVATVSSGDQTEHYEVYLQYGDGSWHVTNYEQLAENPGN